MFTLILAASFWSGAHVNAFDIEAQGVEYIPFVETIDPVITSPEPHTYLSSDDMPASFDWRNINGTNYCGKVLDQKNPNVCGSCWAHAVTGALTDRYKIATNNLFNAHLAPQNLINFNMRVTGGTCEGGDHLKANQFIYQYGITDDTCMPYAGVNWKHGFKVAGMTEVEDVQAHMCHGCSWGSECGFLDRSTYNIYGVQEYGWVRGEEQMLAEIYARGPISCTINSHPSEFSDYQGGIITCNKPGEACHGILTHLIIITGWGVDAATGLKYWTGRNSYGTSWGEGMGGGMFRLERGANTLQIESGVCGWSVPRQEDVDHIMLQYRESL